MKSSSIIAIGTALAGFAMGWIVKPSGDSDSSSTTSTTPPPRERPSDELVAPSRNGDRKPVTLSQVESQVVDPLTIRRQQAFSQVNGKREKARLARFAEALGLDVGQIEAIAALMAKHKGVTTVTPDGLLTDAADGNLDFEDALLALLTDDQKERLNAYKTRTAENQIEASAMRDLAKVMNAVDLSSTQRETILNNFREKNRAIFTEEPDTWNLLTASSDQLNRNNPDFNRYRDIFTDPSITEDPGKLAERLAVEENLRLEEDMGAVSGELTEQQMAELRASLEKSNPVLFGKTIRDPRFR